MFRMSKSITIKEDSLLAIKENMVGTSSVSHNTVCVNEASPEVDEYELGQESNNPPVGGNYCHVEENIDFNDNGVSINDKKILDKYNLSDLILSKNGNYVILNKIVAKELGKGYGSKFMDELTRIADENGWVLALTPDTTFGGSSVSRLKNFYKRFGFFPNKGRNTDFNTRETMVRRPISENIDFEVDSSDIDLSSFKKRDELAPSIWNEEGELNPRIRLKLLDIADDFWDFVNLTWVKPNGIILTGSICNYNWSHYSDIDLHLIVDFDEIDEKTEFVRDYLDAKKNEWNNEHDGLTMLGYQVELYVQNLDEMPRSGGIYDLEENQWIKKPNSDDIKAIGLDKFAIKDKAANIMTIIDDMYETLASTSDSHEIESIGDDAKYLWKKIKSMRKNSLELSGESGIGNVCYKILRRQGYLDKLWRLRTLCYDKTNSISESITESFDKNVDIFTLAKERFGITNDIRECGYVLPDGSMLDFSGKHMVTRDTSHLKGRRGVDHRDIEDLNWDKDMNTRSNVNINMTDFIRKGAIRIHCSNTWSCISLILKPTKEQINPLLRLIQYSKGCVTVEVGDGDNSYEYAEWDEANPRRVINDVMRYFDGETAKLVGNVRESKEIIREYLEKDNNLPLYKYFKWALMASDEEKVRDIIYQCCYDAKNYVDKMSKQNEEFLPFREEIIKNEDIIYDDDFIERLANTIVSNGLTEAFMYYMQITAGEYNLPSWMFMDFRRIVKNEWCIHFGSDSESIAKEGFTRGTDDYERLAYTNAGSYKSHAGYDFAFPLYERDIDYNEYGNEAVIFQTSGVEVYHHGDSQNQVVFWGPNAKNFIPIKYDGSVGEWCIYGMNGQILKSGKPSEILDWALDNLPQYRKQIMAGKNGYIPKYYDYNQNKIVPYPIYRNENVKKYITLLKEETVADGSSTSNPYKERWKAEREALKNFVANYGKLMQSREDDKNGKLYKVLYDKGISQLIGYNFALCVQWDEIQLKPKSVVYIRALDKFTPFIRRNLQYDTRGYDNVRGNYDDIRFVKN